MSTFRHPAFPDVLHRCPDDQDSDAEAKGWLPLLDKKQKRRLKEITSEVEVAQLEADLSPRS